MIAAIIPKTMAIIFGLSSVQTKDKKKLEIVK